MKKEGGMGTNIAGRRVVRGGISFWRFAGFGVWFGGDIFGELL